jgi:uncharacterized membrane protein YbhN (UPF0104 family)
VTATTRQRGRRWFGWVVSLAITVALLTYFFRGIDPGAIVQTARGARPAPFFAFLAILTTGMALRAARFWILLGRVVPFHLVLGITAVRNLLVDLLPARLGELSYVYLVTARANRPLEDGVATMAIAFLLDLVALAPLVLGALFLVGGGQAVSPALAVAVSVALAIVGIAAVLSAGAVARRAGEWTRRAVSSARGQALSGRLHALADRFDRARREGVLLPAFALSVLVRLAKYGSAYCLVLSLLLPMGYRMEDLAIPRIFLGSVAAELAAALPVHGLAGFGTYEAAWALTLEELGYPREHAVISGLLAHAITQAVEYVFGGLALIWLYTRRPVDAPAGAEGSRR